MIVLLLLAFSGLVLLLGVYWTTRDDPSVAIKDYFIAFLLVLYGPQVVLAAGAGESYAPFASPEILSSFYVGMALAYYGIVAGWLAMHFALPRLAHAHDEEFGQNAPVRGFGLAPYLALAWVFLVVALEDFSFEKVRTILDFVTSQGLLDYAEIRQELFEDRLVDEVTRLGRYSVTAILFAATIGNWVVTRRHGLFTALVCCLLFFLCSIEIKKFVYAYYILIALAVGYHVYFETTGRAPFSTRTLWLAALGVLLAFIALFVTLYSIQYRHLIETGQFGLFEALYLTFYRTFLIYGDILLLYFAVYPDMLPHIGGASSRVLMSIFGGQFRDPTGEVPLMIFDVAARETSFPAGFIASGYADFGQVGIFVSGVAVGALVVVLAWTTRLIRDPLMRGVYIAVVGLSMHQLPTTPLMTALLTGGVLSAPILMWVLILARLPLRRSAPARFAGLAPLDDAGGKVAAIRPD